MRKICILLLLFIVSIHTLVAQEKKRTGFRIGLNYSFLRTELLRNKTSSDANLGLTIAVFQEIPLNSLISFQPELAFNRMGGESDNINTKLDYISIPTLFKFHTKRFGFLVGPQVSLLIKAKEKEEFQTETDLKNQLKSIDASAIAGFEYSLGKNNRFVIGLRYVLGMNDILKDAPPGSSLKNQGGQFTAGFRF